MKTHWGTKLVGLGFFYPFQETCVYQHVTCCKGCSQHSPLKETEEPDLQDQAYLCGKILLCWLYSDDAVPHFIAWLMEVKRWCWKGAQRASAVLFPSVANPMQGVSVPGGWLVPITCANTTVCDGVLLT